MSFLLFLLQTGLRWRLHVIYYQFKTLSLPFLFPLFSFPFLFLLFLLFLLPLAQQRFRFQCWCLPSSFTSSQQLSQSSMQPSRKLRRFLTQCLSPNLSLHATPSSSPRASSSFFNGCPPIPDFISLADVAKAHTLTDTRAHTHARTVSHTTHTHTHTPVGALLVQANGEIRALESVRQEREERGEEREKRERPSRGTRGGGRGGGGMKSGSLQRSARRYFCCSPIGWRRIDFCIARIGRSSEVAPSRILCEKRGRGGEGNAA